MNRSPTFGWAFYLPDNIIALYLHRLIKGYENFIQLAKAIHQH